MPPRHKSLVLLAGVILLQVLLLAVQIKRDSQGRLIRTWTVGAVSPFERAGSYGFGWFRDVWRNYFALRSAKKDREDLRRENDALKLRIAQLEGKAAETDRLAALLHFRQSQSDIPMMAARVIGGSAGTASLTIELDRGERDGIRRNMGVITPDGVVGKIVEVFPTTSQVLLMSDKDSGVGALLAETRTHGVVKGSGDPDPRMDYVVNDEKVHPGEMIVTSGEDRIFPKGLLIGTVAGARDGNPFQNIRVQPAARLDRLEDVLILLTQQDLSEKKGSETADSAAPAAKTSGIVQTGALSAPLVPPATSPGTSNSGANASASSPVKPGVGISPAVSPQPQMSAPQN